LTLRRYAPGASLRPLTRPLKPRLLRPAVSAWRKLPTVTQRGQRARLRVAWGGRTQRPPLRRPGGGRVAGGGGGGGGAAAGGDAAALAREPAAGRRVADSVSREIAGLPPALEPPPPPPVPPPPLSLPLPLANGHPSGV